MTCVPLRIPLKLGSGIQQELKGTRRYRQQRIESEQNLFPVHLTAVTKGAKTLLLVPAVLQDSDSVELLQARLKNPLFLQKQLEAKTETP